MPPVDLGPRPAVCPRCGTDAEWTFVDAAKTTVEIACPNCGRFNIPRSEFDTLESEIIDTEDRE